MISTLSYSLNATLYMQSVSGVSTVAECVLMLSALSSHLKMPCVFLSGCSKHCVTVHCLVVFIL